MCQMQPAKLSGRAQGSFKGQEVWSGVLHVDGLNGGHAGCLIVCPGCVAILLALQTVACGAACLPNLQCIWCRFVMPTNGSSRFS